MSSTTRQRRPLAIVTGGAGDIGLAICARLGVHFEIVVADVSPERLAAAHTALEAVGVSANTVPCDVTSMPSVQRLADAASSVGPMRALVHAAGLSPTMADARAIWNVNYVGTANVLDAFLPYATDGTAAVCLASCSAHRAGFDLHDRLLADPRRAGLYDEADRRYAIQNDPGASYAASKRGVVVLCQVRAHVWGRKGARLVSVSPGPTDTKMSKIEEARDNPRAQQIMAAATPSRRARVHELAGVVEFLASDAATYVNGIDLRVDAGAMATLLTSGW